MSKRAERKRKKAEQRSKTIRDAALVLVFGLVLLGLGIFGIRSNGRELREYQGSSDIRTVEAMIVSVSVHDDPTQDEETGGLPRYVWDATLEFRVDDGPTYTDIKQYDHEVFVGDTVKVRITAIDYDNKKVSLSIRSLLEEAANAAEDEEYADEPAGEEPADEE